MIKFKAVLLILVLVACLYAVSDHDRIVINEQRITAVKERLESFEDNYHDNLVEHYTAITGNKQDSNFWVGLQTTLIALLGAFMTYSHKKNSNGKK